MSSAPSAPIDVVHAFMRALEIGDFAAGLGYLSANCEYTNPAPFGTVYGPEAARAVLEPMFAPVVENQLITKREAVNGAVVMIERLDRHRFPNGWVELEMTGVFEVHDGKITVWRDYFDVATFQGGIAAVTQ